VGGVLGLVISIVILALIPVFKNNINKIQTFKDKFVVVGLMSVFIILT